MWLDGRRDPTLGGWKAVALQSPPCSAPAGSPASRLQRCRFNVARFQMMQTPLQWCYRTEQTQACSQMTLILIKKRKKASNPIISVHLKQKES